MYRSNYRSFKFQRISTAVCKDIRIRTFEFEAKTKFFQSPLGNIVLAVYRFGIGGRFLRYNGRFMRFHEKTLQELQFELVLFYNSGLELTTRR